jgi:hypothetical protein
MMTSDHTGDQDADGAGEERVLDPDDHHLPHGAAWVEPIMERDLELRRPRHETEVGPDVLSVQVGEQVVEQPEQQRTDGNDCRHLAGDPEKPDVAVPNARVGLLRLDHWLELDLTHRGVMVGRTRATGTMPVALASLLVVGLSDTAERTSVHHSTRGR